MNLILSPHPATTENLYCSKNKPQERNLQKSILHLANPTRDNPRSASG